MLPSQFIITSVNGPFRGELHKSKGTYNCVCVSRPRARDERILIKQG